MKQSKLGFPISIAVGALPVLALLLTMSGASRLGLGVVAVLAAENESVTPNMEADAPDRLLAALQEREERVRQAEADLALRKLEMSEAEDAIRQQLQTLEAAEAELLSTLSLTATAAETDVARLVAVYESMNPKKAAELFAAMDVNFAAGFFARLRPEIAGLILAELDPMQAYAISAVLAGRHALAPTE